MSLPIGAGTICRDNGETCVLHPVGRVVIAQALRACGPFGSAWVQIPFPAPSKFAFLCLFFSGFR